MGKYFSFFDPTGPIPSGFSGVDVRLCVCASVLLSCLSPKYGCVHSEILFETLNLAAQEVDRKFKKCPVGVRDRFLGEPSARLHWRTPFPTRCKLVKTIRKLQGNRVQMPSGSLRTLF